ncbi:MAG: class I SAM-dependent methyltransferase [Candidatus Babeliales bacterium]|nr:class I SAM-dependent methyltransferase [Candidatus Babeliales bacterium]
MIRDMPWLTKDSIIFLTDFLEKRPNAKILEFGSGASTIWFSRQTKFLTSIEHDEEWYNKVKLALKKYNCHPVDYRLIEENYFIAPITFPNEYFDLVLIDGQTRMKCIKNSLPKLKAGGILMLDNAERHSYLKAYELLQEWAIFRSNQTEPEENDSYPEKQTNWWVKPI